MPGPAPGSRCMACNHPGVALINNLINQGESDYKVAGQFKLPRPTVQRHRTKQHPGISGAAATGGSKRIGKDLTGEQPEPRAPIEPPESDDPRAVMDWLVRTLRDQAEDGDLRADLARELRLAAETQSKMGSGEAPLVVQVRDVAGLGEMLRDMHEALKPFPGARLVMMEVWRKHRAVEDDGQGEVQGGS